MICHRDSLMYFSMMAHDRLTKVALVSVPQFSPQSGPVFLRQWNPIHKNEEDREGDGF